VPSALAGAWRHFGEVDFILYPGDLADRPWRREDWCAPLASLAPAPIAATPTRGFFPSFQGWARGEEDTPAGAPYLQSAPLYAMPGNHEVYGAGGFHGLAPRSADPDGWSIDVFQRLFLPWTRTARPYYAVRHGNVALIALFVARAWRPGGADNPLGAIYREAEPGSPAAWHHGCFTFESIAPGSRQYNWLLRALAKPDFQSAALRIVALHHPIFTCGHDARPRFIEPVAQTTLDPMGVSERTYAYPEEEELLERYLVPLFEQNGVQLVVNGHSHVYGRYVRRGIQYLETSNLGNTYGWDARHKPNAQLECQHHSNAESYLTLVSTEGDTPIGVSICAQDGWTIDRFTFAQTPAQADDRNIS
ncbi:MAG TPA: metallophosphoesterase, partial [Limnochordia bacterium]|nr:metallophosphoesterase [Limnochordia bacterium]